MDEYYESEEQTASEVWNNCVIPSLADIFPKIRDIFLCNILFNLVTQTVVLPSIIFNSVSIGGGIYLLYMIVKENIWHFILFLLCIYVFMYIIHHINIRFSMNVTGIVCILYLLLCEFYNHDQQGWMQVRGLFMIGAMKIMSLSFDLQHGMEFPSIVAFFGYTCCPANSIFGPWIPFKEYLLVRQYPTKKNYKWVLRIISATLISLFFLTVSNCWGTYFIPDDAYKWLLGYRQAQSFRTSHYFISYISEATMIAAGYNDEKHRSVAGAWGYQVTKPLDIEIPTSLVSVVISWNIPMHRFLKKYVYRASLEYGHFKAITITYFVSSLLHGFNIEIAAVLLTIGFYSYIQLKFQDKLSTQLDACLRVRPCKSCQHKYKRNSITVRLLLVLFSLLTILNLIYLGVLMDSVGYVDSPSVYKKWSNLDFLCHWIMSGLHVYTIAL